MTFILKFAMEELTQRLDDLKDQGLYRRLRMVSGPQGPRVVLDGTPVLLLCSNNYLGLSDHPKIREAAADAAMRWGVGAGSSRLVSGSMTIHRRLEERLASFSRTESALLFGSDHLAAIDTITALAPETSTIFADEYNHASLADGCRMAGVPTVIYRHNDLEHLASLLRERSTTSVGRPLIVTDSVFAMEGDLADLTGIVQLARHHDARTLVGEQHATGCVGPGGRGAIAAAGLEREIDVVIGSLDKALGSYGGYVAGDLTLTRYLINTARSLVFSAAPAAPVVAAALASLELLENQPERVDRLQANAVVLRNALRDEGVSISGPTSHITPVHVGDPTTAITLSERLLERRVFAQAIREPSVPADQSLLRLTVSASHTPQELRRAATAVADTARELGLPVAAGPARPSITTSDDSLGEWSAAPSRSSTTRSRTQAADSPAGFFDVEQLDSAVLRARRAAPVGSVINR